MLDIWMHRLGLSSALPECSVVRVEGIDLEPEIRRRMRLWYLQLLDTAPAHLLPVDESSRSSVTVTAEGLFHRVGLPANTRRVLSVKAQGWLKAVEPVSSQQAIDTLRRMPSPYARPGVNSPLAIMADGALYITPVKLPSLDVLRLILDPGPDTYVLDESLLSSIPTSLS